MYIFSQISYNNISPTCSSVRRTQTPSRLVCAVLVNNNSLTVNYGVKQSQFTKPTSEPRASDPEESNEAFGRAI